MSNKIVLYETINPEKLKNIIKCINIPFETTDDLEWFNKFKKQLKFYIKKEKFGKVKVEYEQKNKYGRYNTNCGLQIFQRDVRKYVAGEFHIDLDIVNAHPVILKQLLTLYKIDEDPFLNEYIENRKETIDKYNLASKLSFIKMMYNEQKPENKFLVNTWKKIQELISLLKKEECNKNLINTIKKERIKKNKNYNHLGAFLSVYIQNIENNILMCFYDFLIKKNIVVEILMFDGLAISKNENITQNYLKELIEGAEKYIFDITGYHVNIVEKSTKTEWKPEIKEVNSENECDNGSFQKFKNSTLKDLYKSCYDEEGNFHIDEFNNIVVPYLNNFVCRFDNPMCYGWRQTTDNNTPYRMINKKPDIIPIDIFNLWLLSDDKLDFECQKFIVDDKDPLLRRKTIYNIYKRPKMKKCDVPFVKEKCSLFFDYLYRVIGDNDDKVYNYLLNYIAKMFQVGSTHQGIVLRGKMGVGKSTFPNILAIIIGENYFQSLNDIQSLTSQFNALYENVIITSIEEVITNAGEYHSVQSKLKSLITEKHINIQKKGIDTYVSISNNNFILITNGQNPVKITKDNRRQFCQEVKGHEQQNSNYFGNLIKQVKENVEFLRYFFYTFEYVDNLNSIRPFTDAEKQMLELNLTHTERFIDNHMDLRGDKDDNTRKFSYVYALYSDYCRIEHKKPLSKSYFSASLDEAGYKSERIQKNGSRDLYIQGYTPTREISELIDGVNEIIIQEDL